MKINCISCGHKIDLEDAYDNYEGPVKCYVCGSILEIRTLEGSVKSVHVMKGADMPPGLATETHKAGAGI
jgi:hypothetical protein